MCSFSTKQCRIDESIVGKVSGAYYTEKNEKWFCGKKWFFSKKVMFFPYNMKKKTIFVIKWFFHIFSFCIKTIFNVKWTKKKSFLKSHFGPFDMKNCFFFHIIRKKSHFLRWKPLFGQNDFCQMTIFRIIWLFSFGKKIHFSCKMTFLFPSVQYEPEEKITSVISYTN